MASRESVLAWINKNNNYLTYSNSYASRMKTMKLAFLADGLYKVKYDKSLFDSKFQAWKEGPVDNALYAKQLQFDFSDSDIESLIDNEIKVLEQVNKIYGIYSGLALSQMTHTFESWLEQVDENLDPKRKYIPMNNDTILKDFYVVNSNIKLFEDYSEKYDVEIIEDVTVLIDKNEKDRFNNYIDDNYNEVVNMCIKLKRDGNYLMFIEIDEEGIFEYAV